MEVMLCTWKVSSLQTLTCRGRGRPPGRLPLCLRAVNEPRGCVQVSLRAQRVLELDGPRLHLLHLRLTQGEQWQPHPFISAPVLQPETSPPAQSRRKPGIKSLPEQKQPAVALTSQKTTLAQKALTQAEITFLQFCVCL